MYSWRHPGYLWFLGTAFALGYLPVAAPCDEIRFNSGGTVTGRVVTAEEGAVTVELPGGGTIRLAADRVEHVIPADESAESYQKLLVEAQDMAAAHWQLAEWCRAAGCQLARQAHLQRVLQLEPDHLAARRAMGFVQVHGSWITRREFMQERGYVHYAGRWRVPQEVVLLQEAEQRRTTHQYWLRRMRTWREQLGQPELRATAAIQLRAVRAPEAVPALRELLHDEGSSQVRMLYVEVLGEISTTTATATLLRQALDDLDEEIAAAAAERLVPRSSPPLTHTLVEVLRDPESRRVNRAARILGLMGDPSAVSPLIDALVTTHHHLIPGKSQSTYRFAGPQPDLPMAASAAHPLDAGPVPSMLTALPFIDPPRQAQLIPYQQANQPVLDALARLTGTSFGYNREAWRIWWAQQTAAP